jgi:SAM-dependent methyltransferase
MEIGSIVEARIWTVFAVSCEPLGWVGQMGQTAWVTLPRPMLYDWECRHVLGRTDQDVAFWLGLARRADGPVLELACGTGRVTGPLAAAGIDVVGLDVDPAMLAWGRRGPFPLPYLVAADMRGFAFGRKFAAVIIPYNSFQLLTAPSDADACLKNVRQHLNPGGLFGLEVTDFQSGAVHAEVEDQVIAKGELDGVSLTLSGSLSHDFTTKVSRYQRRFITDRWEVSDLTAIRSYRRAELTELLTKADFTLRQTYEDGPVTRLIFS